MLGAASVWEMFSKSRRVALVAGFAYRHVGSSIWGNAILGRFSGPSPMNTLTAPNIGRPLQLIYA